MRICSGRPLRPGGRTLDPDAFDGMIRRFSHALSRRTLVGGAVGAWALAMTGLARPERAQAKPRAEACVPNGRRCGKGRRFRPCGKCCSRFSVADNRGRRTCACAATGTGCTDSIQCCSGLCETGLCRAAPCSGAGVNCRTNLDCCSSVCGCVVDFSPFAICFCRNATCGQPGAPCTTDAECCTEFCDFDNTCAEP
jgi:hypothetical protein